MSFDVNKLRAGAPSLEKINGTILFNQREEKYGNTGKYPSPNVQALRTTSKSVTAIGGAVRDTKPA